MFGAWWTEGSRMLCMSLNKLYCYRKAQGKQPPNRNKKSSKKFIFTCSTNNPTGLLSLTDHVILNITNRHWYAKNQSSKVTSTPK